MKQRPSMQPQIFDSPHQQAILTKPNPPTEEIIKRAQFIDKTYIWKHAGVRPRDGRSTE